MELYLSFHAIHYIKNGKRTGNHVKMDSIYLRKSGDDYHRIFLHILPREIVLRKISLVVDSRLYLQK